MHSRNYNSYNSGSCNTCNVCKQPEPKCGCPTTKKKIVPIGSHAYDCNTVYMKGQCVALESCGSGLFFTSKTDNNLGNTPMGTTENQTDFFWAGPSTDICSLISESGIKGDKGEKGDVGATGATGATGQKGDTGNTGAEGQRGDTGLTGQKGDTGEKGDTGDVGARGEKGDQGDKGDTGERGETGLTGDRGIQGIAGDQGIEGTTGDTGATGDRGLTGADGAIGANGERGLQGIQGEEGQQGLRGDQGVKGDNGLPFNVDTVVDTLPAGFTCPATGTSSVLEASTGLLHICVDGVRQDPIEFGRGEAGEKGERGDIGLTGPKGEVGDTGLRGQDGVKGERGDIGPRGDTGERGVKGDIGNTGPAGNDGDRGGVGDRGEKGDVGNTGQRGEKGDVGSKGDRGEKGDKGDRGDIGLRGDTGSQGEKGDKGDKGDPGIQGEIGPSGGPPGEQGPMANITIGDNGNWFVNGVDSGQPATGPAGKDYDPNCQAAVVVEVLCANIKGNITLVFEEVDGVQDTHEMPVAVFKPTNRDLLSAIEETNPTTNEKFWTTVNHIDAKITWNRKPTVGMNFILSDFKAGEMTDFNKQAIRFDVIDLNGGCLGYGVWELLIECNNCNCVIPTLHVETDATGKECAIWNDGKGGVVKLALCNKTACGTIDQYPNCDPLLAKKWEESCTTGVDIGYYTHCDAYWLNSESGNTSPPESMENWHGPFGTYELIQHHINTVVDDRVAIIVNNILQMRGLV